jgi:ATP-binding cassette, subfamily B, bacterial PglK
MKTIYRIYSILDYAERKSLHKLLCLVIVMAILDTLGVISIMPFMALLSNPDFIFEYDITTKIYNYFQLDNYFDFLIIAGGSLLLFFIISLMFKAYVSFLTIRFAMEKEYSISKRLFSNHLNQPYSWYLEKNTSELTKTILSEVATLISYGVTPFLNVIAYGFVSVALLALLIVIDPFLAFACGIILGGSYAIIFLIVSKIVDRLGRERAEANGQRFNIVSESFGGIKDIKLRDLEKDCINKFDTPAKIYASRQALAQAMSLLPRFALEAISFGGILALAIYLIFSLGELEKVLPILSLYALGAYRLMPALHQVYSSLTYLSFVEGALESIAFSDNYNPQIKANAIVSNLELKKNLYFDNVHFGYNTKSQSILKGVTLDINAGSRIAFIGPTGSGKSTTVDLIAGLLTPSSGKIFADGSAIDGKSIKSWKKNIGYVPQTIYLNDDTIISNIAYGVPRDKIDLKRIEKVAKIACIHDFIISELDLGYQTRVGERGVRFSGGQRQRLGIARALYHGPSILILDEGTSALDFETETLVMDGIRTFSEHITVIIVAHRLHTIKDCDKIYYFDKGKVKVINSLDNLELA